MLQAAACLIHLPPCCETEVTNLQGARGAIDKDVVTLEVPMYDGWGVTM